MTRSGAIVFSRLPSETFTRKERQLMVARIAATGGEDCAMLARLFVTAVHSCVAPMRIY